MGQGWRHGGKTGNDRTLKTVYMNSIVMLLVCVISKALARG
jgi:hypothetical protein